MNAAAHENGVTALIVAAARGRAATIRTLGELGADPHKTSKGAVLKIAHVLIEEIYR